MGIVRITQKSAGVSRAGDDQSRSKDVAAIVGATSEFDRLMPADWTIAEILESLAALVRCDLLFWTRFDVTTPRVIAEIGYPHGPIAAPTEDWIEHRLEHPICSGLHGPVVALSDVLGPRACTGPGSTRPVCGARAGSTRSG